ncbi:MAG: Lrp/AsnC family transcriptional regulator, partial [Selenomonadaceae bacterium]|nr:Lrp/AsnC family transcriptional regulator [Selenomonadaceae bacterium]
MGDEKIQGECCFQFVSEGFKLDEAGKRVIRALQEDFPLVAEPYKELAKIADMTETEFLRRILKLKETGAI